MIVRVVVNILHAMHLRQSPIEANISRQTRLQVTPGPIIITRVIEKAFQLDPGTKNPKTFVFL